MSSRKVVRDSLSIKTTEHDDEEVPDIDELQEVCSGVAITNCVAFTVTVFFIFQGDLLKYHNRNRNKSYSPIITIETFCLWMVILPGRSCGIDFRN